MKQKLTLCIALVLNGAFFGYSMNQRIFAAEKAPYAQLTNHIGDLTVTISLRPFASDARESGVGLLSVLLYVSPTLRVEPPLHRLDGTPISASARIPGKSALELLNLFERAGLLTNAQSYYSERIENSKGSPPAKKHIRTHLREGRKAKTAEIKLDSFDEDFYSNYVISLSMDARLSSLLRDIRAVLKNSPAESLFTDLIAASDSYQDDLPNTDKALVEKSGAKPEDFNAETIEIIWKEIWKSGAPEISEPKIEKLSEQQVVNEMAGKWNAMFDSDKLLISLETNRQVSVSGIRDGKAWEKRGEWKVVSDRLVLFLPEDDLPSFVFRQKGKIYIFNPWAATMMSEMHRPNQPAARVGTNAPPQAIRAVNGKISKAQILDILDSIDKALVNQDAAAVVANFASNAVITATVVENGEKHTTKNDTASYRKNLEAGFQGFDNYKIQRKEITVEITPDRQKTTSASTLIETYLFDGNAKQAVTKEAATFEVIDGKILVTQMNSKLKIK